MSVVRKIVQLIPHRQSFYRLIFLLVLYICTTILITFGPISYSAFVSTSQTDVISFGDDVTDQPLLAAPAATDEQSSRIADQPRATERVKKTNNKPEEDLSQLFNDSCRPDLFQLPVYARKQCGKTNSVCERLTCRDVLTGSVPKDVMTNMANWKPDRFLTDSDVLAATGNCSAFRKSRGFDEISSLPGIDEAVDFPIAFNILAHRNADQVVRLLRALYRPQNVYCIHVDAKSAAGFRLAMQRLTSCFDNVRLASHLEQIVYAGFSRLQADITCMRDHLNNTRTHWRYLINTAGQAFPLRTNEEIVRILRIYNGANDIEGIYGYLVIRERFEKEWKEDFVRNVINETGRMNPPPPHDIDIVRGSAYGVFSRDFVRFILEDQRARDLLEWSRKAYSPDEFYWSTLHHTYSNPHLKTPGGFAGHPHKKRWLAVYANWGEIPCNGLNIRGVCVFGVGDMRQIVQHKELFVNKFYADYQPLALHCLEAWIQHKQVCRPNIDYTYYQQLPFIKKKEQQTIRK